MSGVVVWSYMNDRRQWNAYEPSVSVAIENAFANGIQQRIDLGIISPALLYYEVDIVNMRQIQKYTGSARSLQRSVLPPESCLSQGYVWEFEGDTPSHWVVYDVESLELIEGAYSGLSQPGASWLLDLLHSPLRLPYIIDFKNSTQTRTDTGKVRRIQRRALSQLYSSIPGLTNSASGQSLSSLTSSSSSSSLSSSSSSNQGSTVVPNWSAYQAKHKSSGHKGKQRLQPYTGKHLSGQVGPGSSQAQGTGQNLSSQTGLPHHLQYQQQIQQLQQGIQQLQSPHNQLNNIPGPLTRSRLQQSSTQAANHNAISAPASQQMPHAQLPSVQQHQQQLQQPQPQQHLVYPQPIQNMPGLGRIPHQTQPTQGPGLPLGFHYAPIPIQQPASVGFTGVRPPLAHQQPQAYGMSSSLPSSLSASNSEPESLPSVNKVTIGKNKKSKPKTGMEVLGRYMRSVQKDLDKNDCSICFDKLSEASSYGEGRPDAHDVVELTQCNHQFHKLCLLEMYHANHKDDSLQCPSCKTIYGEKTGNCPPGYMQWQIAHGLTLAGYEGYNTICVSYHISSGVQGPEHPCPGQRYSARGFPRQGYIPDTDQGRKVLKLLMEAFRRRLMFTIATSHTTGETNTVTWNEIHHKTEPHGNHSGHGYPDPKYLDNVLLELAAHGVTEDCLS